MFFQHQSENYQFSAGFYVDREALLKHQTATLVVRSGLMLNGVPVSLQALRDVKLTITSTDHDGIQSKQEVDEFKIWEDRESEYQFQVPPRLASIDFSIRAKVEVASRNTEVEVAQSDSFQINSIDQTEKLEDLHLAKIDGEYFIDLLGKSGEVRPSRPIQIEIHHREFTQSVKTTLQTNDHGRLALGALRDVDWVAATGPEATKHSWHLIEDRHTQYGNIHAAVGETITIPYMSSRELPIHAACSLLEIRGGSFAGDHADNIEVADGYLKIANLPAGDYSLLLKSTGRHINIRVARGARKLSYILGPSRQLEQRNPQPLQIDEIDIRDGKIRVQLQGASKFARVHVFASRFQPAHLAFRQFAKVHDVEPLLRRVGSRRSLYKSGRTLGEEEQYILDRQYAKHYPGSMLSRPSLLLNPWDIRTTETGQQSARGGEDFGGEADAENVAAARPGQADSKKSASGGFSNLDFLGETAPLMLNLVANEEGVVEISRAALGPNHQLQVVAIDPLTTVSRMISLPATPRKYDDLRLIAGLDPKKHFTRKKNITIVAAQQEFEISDVGSARFASYDRLDDIYAVMLTLNNDPQLAEFSFALRWPTLDDEDKQELYSQYACHELNFYLSKKDPEFFEQVVRPYVSQKFHKTFMDHWLLGNELSAFFEPWSYSQLNVVERILLGRAVRTEQPHAAQHVRDLFHLQPRDVTRWNYLFESALSGKRLSYSGVVNGKFIDEQKKIRKSIRTRSALKDMDRVTGGIANGGQPFSAERAPSADAVLADDNVKSERKSGAVRFSRDALDTNEQLLEESDEFFEQLNVAGGLGGGGRLYQKLDATKEWVENNYYRLPIEQQNADLVTVNSFWNGLCDPFGRRFFLEELGGRHPEFYRMHVRVSSLRLATGQCQT